MTRTKKVVLSLSAASLVALGIAYYFNPWPHTSLDPRFHPHLNPNPSRFLTIYGRVDKALSVKLTSVFFTNNPKCNHWVAVLEGVSGPYSATYDDTIKPNKNGNYKIRIPLDRVESGFCGWQLNRIEYAAAKNDSTHFSESYLTHTNYNRPSDTTKKFTQNVDCEPYNGKPFFTFICKLGSTNYDAMKGINPNNKLQANFHLTRW